MKSSKFIVTSAIAGLMAWGVNAHAASHAAAAPAADGKSEKEKCYGVVEKGKNDCGTAKHSCAGKATADKGADEWKFVAKGSCEKMGGKTAKPDAGKEAPKQSYGG